MSQIDRRAIEHQLRQEFPDLELHKWYSQYRRLKAGYPDTVLFYRMGDFYEAFDDDAKLLAELLDITLTYKKFGNHKRSKEDQRCPMAGMPYHAIERYVASIIGAGYRVAIAEQISETPSSKSDTRVKSVFAAGIEQNNAVKGMVDRKVVRVITPGTVVDTGMLTASQNNYLVSIIVEGQRIGLAYVDLSTGEFACTEFAGDRAVIQAQGELARLQAAEVLVPEEDSLRLPGLAPSSAGLTQDLEFMTKEERDMLLPGERVARRTERENTTRWAHGQITPWPTRRWDLRTTRDDLTHHFRVQSLAGFGMGDKPLATRAAGILIQYVNETQDGAASHITSIRTYTTGDVMFLDPQTRRNLELLEGSSGGAKGSLVDTLDHTRLPMGARLLRRWVSQPLLNIEQLRSRQDSIAHFADNTLLRAEIRDQLKQIGDVERAVNRVLQGVTIATPRDLVRLREALRSLPSLMKALDGWCPPSHEHQRVLPKSDVVDDAAVPSLIEEEPPSDDRFSDPSTPSLREQREAERKIAPRYEANDLFGEDDWNEPDVKEAQVSPASVQPSTTVSSSAIASPTSTPVDPMDEVLQLDPCEDVLAFLERALDDDPPALLGASNYMRAHEGGETPRRVIRPGFAHDMDALVDGARDAQHYITQLEPRERERTGIKSLRVDYNKVFGYYIEVPKSYADQVPSEYVRKQTLTAGERYFTSELKEYENVVLGAQERLAELERSAFVGVCQVVAAEGRRLLTTARLLGEIDVYTALAEAAVRGRYVRPTLYEDTRLNIVAGRHPVVERSLNKDFIANDATLNTDDHQILLVTGPNMAGKSTILRQVALISLMAQIGSFVPADSAEIGLVDRIFTRIGAQDDIATGQSTFMVEMTETAALLLQSTQRSLIILDEVGRGTSTYDGMAIARAVVEYIHNEPRLGCRTMFATHYHELTDLEQVLPRVKNYYLAALEQDDRIVFLHELRRGCADRSYGIHVAELAGIPRPVIRRANELLAELEQGHKTILPSRERDVKQQSMSDEPAAVPQQPSLFDIAPSPLIEMIRRLNVNELSPIEALTKLYELQRMTQNE
ncbi:MAG: DNA mismatch repair protein MutS [Chloroflexi bacterium AL-W]|nr:DNA mismatch repair protein MutS [Chloroflexi bacterium AL-N1]NOK69690.1 DNA mismatch repair protein MutS [Chloroflexi bacterium AL-N10]NOK72237.1 DNA mismatch repair protein MutS [Chloroflexi bacterium AL-N5]NOK85066.1 DNA mismatch repair protein MutS [Chloroflexi bacterium AL-W]NOK91819.1 DNA mismatch repair protein MutS [Chloroflexi bacterium AL-N15]